MKKNKVLTISIAAYNVEKTLPRLIDSLIVEAVIDELQILIINDGSTDQTAFIAEQYVKKYPESIFLINKRNGGHGSTINKGIELAKGKYFKVIDGDDWVNESGLVETVSRLKNDNADIIINDYIDCYTLTKEKSIRKACEYNDKALLKTNTFLSKVSWIRFHAISYKTELLKKNNIKVSENTFYDDIQYVMYPLLYAKTVRYNSIPLYCYRIGEIGQSISMEGRKKHVKDAFLIGKQITLFLENNKFKYNICRFIKRGVINHWEWYIGTLVSFSLKEYKNTNFREVKEFLKANDKNIDQALREKLSVYRYMTENDFINKIIFFLYKLNK